MTHASPHKTYQTITEQRCGQAVSVYTGGSFVGRGGMKIGPFRPFRDEEDGATEDAVGRSAWFFAEGVGAFDRYGCFLSGVPENSPLDCVAMWPAEHVEIDREFSI
ncbi:hypothetical protein [Mesorhizobium sp. NZP2234]|uniref:hypothetical protein n=1 Tax=Mesorhizobium sp. NZP2234 TaxID=2483402 RepID=UPI0015578245|nr:hypothetical protein [Mesorhizobium sp. NZP2234]